MDDKTCTYLQDPRVTLIKLWKVRRVHLPRHAVVQAPPAVKAQRCAMTHQHTCWFQLRVEFWPLGMARMHVQARTAQMWGGFKCKTEISGHSCNFASVKTASNVTSKRTRTDADTSHNLITCRNYLWSPGRVFESTDLTDRWSRSCTWWIFLLFVPRNQRIMTVKKCLLCKAHFTTLLML